MLLNPLAERFTTDRFLLNQADHQFIKQLAATASPSLLARN